MRSMSILISWVSLSIILGCSHEAELPVSAGFGPDPVLPPPAQTLIPTVKSPAKGWPSGVRPTAAEGLTVTAFADKLDHPRWLYVLPNGDVLVAETNAPPKPEDHQGIQRLGHEKGHEKGRGRRSQRQSHIAAARRRRGRQGGFPCRIS